jgi:hypothetical protein
MNTEKVFWGAIVVLIVFGCVGVAAGSIWPVPMIRTATVSGIGLLAGFSLAVLFWDSICTFITEVFGL